MERKGKTSDLGKMSWGLVCFKGWCRKGGMMLTLTTEARLQRIRRGHALGQLDVEPEVLGGGSGHEGEGEHEELHGEVRKAGGHCTARPDSGGAFME